MLVARVAFCVPPGSVPCVIWFLRFETVVFVPTLMNLAMRWSKFARKSYWRTLVLRMMPLLSR